MGSRHSSTRVTWTVHAPTLIGVGDRADEGGPETNLSAHVQQIVELIEAEGRPFAFVITQAKPRTRLAAEALRVLAEHGRVVPAVLFDRTDYPVAAVSGLAVTEAAPGSKAAQEVIELLGFVERQLRGKKGRS